MTKQFIDSHARRGGVSRPNGRTIVSSPNFGAVRFEYISNNFYLTFPGSWKVKVTKKNMIKLAEWIKVISASDINGK